MTRLAKALAALGIAGLSLVPLAAPARAHVPNAGTNHLDNCSMWVHATLRPFQPGDGPGDGCVMVIQSWVNRARNIRILGGQPVPAQWQNLVVDGDYGPNTTGAVYAYQSYYVTGGPRFGADALTMATMLNHCGNFPGAIECDH